MILVKKLEFFLYLFLVKIRLEITVTDDLEKIEAFTDFENVNFSSSQKSYFSNILTKIVG